MCITVYQVNKYFLQYLKIATYVRKAIAVSTLRSYVLWYFYSIKIIYKRD